MTIFYILLILATFRLWMYIFLTPIVALWQIKLLHKKDSLQNFQINTNYTQSKNEKISIIKCIKTKLRLLFAGGVRLHVFYTAYIPSHHIRNFVYRNIYRTEIGKRSVIYYGAELRGTQLIHVGEGTIIGDKATLDARRGGIFIGRFVRINSNVSMWTGSHDMNDPFFRSLPGKRGPIRVGDRVFIGPNVTILHSVTIGEGAVIAAGAVVTKDVEPFTVVAGVPARKIGERSRNLLYTYPSSPLPFL